jgi:hypothetical protein
MQRPFQWANGKGARGVTMTSHLHRVSKLEIGGAIHPFSHLLSWLAEGLYSTLALANKQGNKNKSVMWEKEDKKLPCHTLSSEISFLNQNLSSKLKQKCVHVVKLRLSHIKQILS